MRSVRITQLLCHHYDTFFFQYFTDSLHQLFHIIGKDLPDISNAEGIGLAQLSRINDEAPVIEFLVESFEIEIRTIGI